MTVSVAEVREIASVTVDCESGGMLGDVGQRLLGDAIQRQPDAGGHPIQRPVDIEIDL